MGVDGKGPRSGYGARRAPTLGMKWVGTVFPARRYWCWEDEITMPVSCRARVAVVNQGAGSDGREESMDRGREWVPPLSGIGIRYMYGVSPRAEAAWTPGFSGFALFFLLPAHSSACLRVPLIAETS